MVLISGSSTLVHLDICVQWFIMQFPRLLLINLGESCLVSLTFSQDQFQQQLIKPIVLLNSKEHTHVHCCVHRCCVINECHACRGTDFQKAFGRIGGLRALTKCLFMSLTASAPPTIESSIKSSLALVNPVMVSQPLDRFNIYISVSKKIIYGCKFVISTWYNRLPTLISRETFLVLQLASKHVQTLISSQRQ